MTCQREQSAISQKSAAVDHGRPPAPLAILGNARAERDHHPVLEVLDREASLFSF
jgi:hypothetical protein